MPLANTRLIPTGWSAHHATVLPTSFNAKVTVGYRTGTAYDAATDSTEATWSVEYAGGARIQRLVGDHPAEQAGQQLTGQPYLVEVDWACPAIRPGARVRITEAANDASAVGEDLWVVAAPLGSERFTRSIFCSDAESDVPAAA